MKAGPPKRGGTNEEEEAMAPKLIAFDEEARRALKRGIERAVELTVEAIKNQSRDVEEKDEIAHVGAISAADPEIGEQIAEAVDKVGKDGDITVEESNT